jgi:hypothetical protein
MTITASAIPMLGDLNEDAENSFNLMHFSPTASKGFKLF